MHGLSSRQSLATKQLKWRQDTDELVRNNSRATSQGLGSPSSSERSIITLTRDESPKSPDRNASSAKSFPSPSNHDLECQYETLFSSYSKLEEECSSLRKLVRESLVRIERLEQKLASVPHPALPQTTVPQPVIPQSVIPHPVIPQPIAQKNLYVQTTVPLPQQKTNVTKLVIPTPQKGRGFVPFFNRSKFDGPNNQTVLTDNHLDMTLNIPFDAVIHRENQNHTIYPFGLETNVPNFADITLELSIKDKGGETGTAFGLLKREDHGVYTITLTEIYRNGKVCQLENYYPPLTMVCHWDLVSD